MKYCECFSVASLSHLNVYLTDMHQIENTQYLFKTFIVRKIEGHLDFFYLQRINNVSLTIICSNKYCSKMLVEQKTQFEVSLLGCFTKSCAAQPMEVSFI